MALYEEAKTFSEINDWESAFHLTVKIANKLPDVWQVWELLCSAYLNLGEFDKASNALQTLFKIAPNHPQGLSNQVQLLVKLGREDEALTALHQLLATDDATKYWKSVLSACAYTHQHDLIIEWINQFSKTTKTKDNDPHHSSLAESRSYPPRQTQRGREILQKTGI